MLYNETTALPITSHKKTRNNTTTNTSLPLAPNLKPSNLKTKLFSKYLDPLELKVSTSSAKKEVKFHAKLPTSHTDYTINNQYLPEEDEHQFFMGSNAASDDCDGECTPPLANLSPKYEDYQPVTKYVIQDDNNDVADNLDDLNSEYNAQLLLKKLKRTTSVWPITANCDIPYCIDAYTHDFDRTREYITINKWPIWIDFY